MLPHAEVHITDWADARMCRSPKAEFQLDDDIDYVIEMMRGAWPDLASPCRLPPCSGFAAWRLMHACQARTPVSMTLMRSHRHAKSPTRSSAANERAREWYERHVITSVPWTYPCVAERSIPGFVQLSRVYGHEYGPPCHGASGIFSSIL